MDKALCWAEEKIKGKKDSKQKKKKKTLKEKAGPGINMQEAQERLRARIAELQGMLWHHVTGQSKLYHYCAMGSGDSPIVRAPDL